MWLCFFDISRSLHQVRVRSVIFCRLYRARIWVGGVFSKLLLLGRLAFCVLVCSGRFFG